MATKEETRSLREKLEPIAQYSAETLVSRPGWGDLNFKEVEHNIFVVIDVAQDLLELPIKYIPSSDVTEISGIIDQIAQALARIDSLDLNNYESSTKQTIIDQVSSYGDAFIKACAVWTTFLAKRHQDLQDQVRQLRETNATVEREADEFRLGMQTKAEEVEGILHAAREAAAEAGVATFTEQFDKESGSLERRSYWWLGITIVLAAMTIGFSLVLYFHNQEGLAGPIAIGSLNLIIAKLSIVAMLVAVTFWCGRIYKSLVHLSTVNRHRALSLKTFQAFASATDDARIRDSVLTAATNCIFSNVPTGFVDQRNMGNDPAVQFVEIGKQQLPEVT